MCFRHAAAEHQPRKGTRQRHDEGGQPLLAHVGEPGGVAASTRGDPATIPQCHAYSGAARGATETRNASHPVDAASYHRAMALAKNARGGEESEVEPPLTVNVLIKGKGWIVPVVIGTGDVYVKGKKETTMTHQGELAFALTFDKSHNRSAEGP